MGSVILQGILALILIKTHTLSNTLQNVGAILTLFAALTAVSLFRVRFGRPDLPRPPGVSLVAAGVYVASAAWMLYFGFQGKTHLLPWVGVVAAVALVGYLWTRRGRDQAGADWRSSSTASKE